MSSAGVLTMLAHYAPIARRSAAVTAAVAVIMVAISAAAGGSKGLLAAAIAIGVVALFFGISIIAVGRAARVSPAAMMATAIGTYLVKIIILLFLVGQFQNSTAFNPRLFGLTAIVLVLAWSAAQVVWSMRLKMLYVEPDGKR
jgi:ATP synthase protein I